MTVLFDSGAWQAAGALLAVVVATYAVHVSRRSEREVLHHDMVSGVYDEFDQLAQLRLDNWELSHLLELPETYEPVKEVLRRARSDTTDERHAELTVRERAVAIRVFTLFEQTCYYRTQADAQKDTTRAAFLDEVLAYFTGRLLRNPRLQFLWRADGGNLRSYFEESTIAYYDSCMAHVPDVADGSGVDPVGPYGKAAHEVADTRD